MHVNSLWQAANSKLTATQRRSPPFFMFEDRKHIKSQEKQKLLRTSAWRASLYMARHNKACLWNYGVLALARPTIVGAQTTVFIDMWN